VFLPLVGHTKVLKNVSVQQPLSMEPLPFPCHPERSRGICSSADLSWKGHTASQTELSSRPERIRISCHAALDTTARAPFFKERRMRFANATNFYRKSG
jgi:hypothetical protein